MKRWSRSEKKAMAGALAYLLAVIFGMVLCREATIVLMGLDGPSAIRFVSFAFATSLLVVAASNLLNSRSLLWQIPFQSIAVGLLVAGVPVLVGAVFQSRPTFHGLVAKAATASLLGLGVGGVLQHLQRRPLPGQDA